QIRAVDVVAAGEHAPNVGAAGCAVDQHETSAIKLQLKALIAKNGVSRIANGDNRRIAGNLKLRAGNGNRAPSPAFVRLGQFHTLTFERAQAAGVIREKAKRNREIQEFHSLLTRVPSLLLTSTHLGFGSAVHA